MIFTNNKGFTLVEVLATISIMAVIALMVNINVVDIFEEQQNISNNNIKNIIEEAACVYIELDENLKLKEKCLTIGCKISTDTLINKGLLEQKDVDKFAIINIYKSNNQKICKIKEE